MSPPPDHHANPATAEAPAPRQDLARLLPGPGRRLLGSAEILAWGVLLGLLGWHLASYLGFVSDSFSYPFELDYGEGIVWQQALLIPGPRMYGDINRYPFIVFHYPPFYHLAVRAVASLGMEWLPAGRAVSLGATLACAVIVGGLAWQGSRAAGRGAALRGALLAALVLVTLEPIITWSPLMRVDMLGVGFAMLSLWLGVQALRRPWLLHAAMLAGVAAVFTKQTLVAAPAAVLAVHLLRDPRRAVWAGLSGLLAGLAVLGWLSWATGGGFLRHIVLYNINRFSLELAWNYIQLDAAPILIYLGLLLLGVIGCWWRLLRAATPGGWRRDPGFGLTAIITLYLLLASAMLVTIGKSGSNVNYYLEWVLLLGLWLGLLPGLAATLPERRGLRRWAGLVLPAALAVQVALLPRPAAMLGPETYRYRDTAAMEARMRTIPGPILTDNMTLLLRTGHEVPYEPAIFVELLAKGLWDERPLLELIERRFFAAVITYGDPGNPLLDSRYSPAAIAAILANYPEATTIGEFRLRLPR